MHSAGSTYANTDCAPLQGTHFIRFITPFHRFPPNRIKRRGTKMHSSLDKPQTDEIRLQDMPHQSLRPLNSTHRDGRPPSVSLPVSLELGYVPACQPMQKGTDTFVRTLYQIRQMHRAGRKPRSLSKICRLARTAFVCHEKVQ